MLIDGLDGTAGLHIQEACGRFRWLHNDRLRFPAASLIKLPIYYEYRTRVSRGDLDPAEKITLSKHSVVGGCGILKAEPPGSVHTLDRVAQLMIAASDNTAANILIDILGKDRINAAAATLGMKDTILQRKMMDFESRDAEKDNWTTPRDVFVFLDELLHPRHMSPDLGAEILSALKCQRIKTKLPAWLPPSAVAAHKTGELDGVEHDAGILFNADRCCTVVALTKDLKCNDDGIAFCRRIGHLVYEAVGGTRTEMVF
ncbi:MAG: serine hydrolase [Desulfobacterales bacterium]